jgi:hypothetical protein
MKIVRGMTENFNEKCDLIVSHPRAALNPRMRKTPMLLLGRAVQIGAMRMRVGANITEDNEVLTWGTRGEMRVWVVNAPNFALPKELRETPTPESMDDLPVDLIEALLVEYPGAKQIVADPSMGSGAVGVAALNLDLDFLGVESYVEPFDRAQARLTRGQ